MANRSRSKQATRQRIAQMRADIGTPLIAPQPVTFPAGL
jgi:hypothetical protein